MAPALPELQWIVVLGAFGAFLFGYGTGANDVANAFGTSVGSKTLTLKQATILAVIFEFGGALLLGRVSTSTIAGSIANVAEFQREPEIYAYGMMINLWVGGVWQIIASSMGFNVSATHSIIGGIIGFSLIYGGKDGVNWALEDKKSFPPYKGVLPIVLSWFFSPILTSIASASIFATCRALVLRRSNGYNLTFFLLPPLVMLTTFINMYFVFTKGAKKTLSSNSDWTDSKAAWVAAVIAAGVTLLATVIGLPLLRKMSHNHFDRKEAADKAGKNIEEGDADAANLEDQTKAKNAVEAQTEPRSAVRKLRDLALRGLEYDIHQHVDEDPIVAALHERAEKFDPKIEHAFSYLQVFSAICVILAHGAGEVGYMAGPLGSIWYIYNKGTIAKSFTPPVWIILIGALGLVFGLATYGYRVTAAMGVQMAKLSPSRGFAAELATSFVIMIAAQYGLPTSSSQCITGGIIGVGFMEGVSGVNWKFFGQTFASWVSTLAIIGLSVGALFSQGVYAPSIPQSKMIRKYEDGITNLTLTQYKFLNTTLFNYKAAAQAGNLTRLTADQWNALSATIKTNTGIVKNQTKVSLQGSVDPEPVFFYLAEALRLAQANSISTLGQNTVFPTAPICNSNTSTSATSACPALTLIGSGTFVSTTSSIP